jgi:hypothetical protein
VCNSSYSGQLGKAEDELTPPVLELLLVDLPVAAKAVREVESRCNVMIMAGDLKHFRRANACSRTIQHSTLGDHELPSG